SVEERVERTTAFFRNWPNDRCERSTRPRRRRASSRTAMQMAVLPVADDNHYIGVRRCKERLSSETARSSFGHEAENPMIDDVYNAKILGFAGNIGRIGRLADADASA